MNNSELRNSVIEVIKKTNDTALLRRIYLILLVSTRR